MAAIQYLYIVLTPPRIIAISSHTYVSRTIRLEPALTYLSGDTCVVNSDFYLPPTVGTSKN